MHGQQNVKNIVSSCSSMTHEDGTDRVFRNVGTENTDAGESPKLSIKQERIYSILTVLN
jgi:hypothetical protein